MNDIMKLAQEDSAFLTQIRREFHQHPELSFQEKWTSERIRQELDKMKIPYVMAGNYGIVATIEGKNTGTMVALRADMDALPIQENNDHISYQSQIPNVMHACGHDTHITMLLGAARILLQVKDQINGIVKLCFQQAEEVSGGAVEILNELSKFPIKSTFGIHIYSGIDVGTVAIMEGPAMSGNSGWTVTFKGKGTHGAMPDKGISPIIAGSAFVQNLNSARNYEINPFTDLVITIGSFQSGQADNVIPETATIMGTIRIFSEDDRTQLKEIITRVADGTAKTYRNEVTVDITEGIPPLINDPTCTKIAHNSVFKLLGNKGFADFSRAMPSENYGLYVAKYPGLMAFVGGKNDAKGCNHPHHHPQFNIDEDALPVGAALYAQYTIDFLGT
ncbi:MAG: M20 metallopeptidase family protein [Brevinema sp.]